MNEQEILKALQDAIAALQTNRPDVLAQLSNPDGSYNYAEAARLLMSKSPDAARWRAENGVDELVKQAGINAVSDGALSGVMDLVKAGIGANQIRQARKIDVTPPARVKATPNANLRRALSMAARRASEGLSASERAKLDSDIAYAASGSRRALSELTGGQGGTGIAGAQALTAQQMNAALGAAAANEQAMRQGLQQYGQLSGMQAQEDADIRAGNIRQLLGRDMALWQEAVKARQSLATAGQQNLVGGLDAAAGRLSGAMGASARYSNAFRPAEYKPLERAMESSGDSSLMQIAEVSKRIDEAFPSAVAPMASYGFGGTAFKRQ